MLAKAQLVVPVPIPQGQQQQYRSMWDAPHLAFSTTVQRFTGRRLESTPPSTSLPIAVRIFPVQLRMSGAHLSPFCHMLTSSCLAQCGSKKYPLHHTGLQRSRVAMFLFHTPARNSLGDSGCRVTAAWLHPEGAQPSTQPRLHQLMLSALLGLL